MCSLCSRLRRGVLYRVAAEIGATKIALGHHRDDLMATFFLNLFFGGKLKTMPPKLVSDDGRHVVIRPLAYVRERDLARYAELNGVPDHSLHALRLAGASAAQAGRARCCASGRRNSPGASSRSSTRSATSCRRICIDRTLSTSRAVARPARPTPDGDIAFDVDPALEAATEAAAAIAASRSTPSACGARPTTDRRSAHPGHALVLVAVPRLATAAIVRRRSPPLRPLAPAAQTVAPAQRRRCRHRAADALAPRRLRPLLPAHVDRLRPERRRHDVFDDCTNQRNLTDKRPRRSARDRRRHPRARHPVGEVLASPFCRTLRDRGADLRPRDRLDGGARRARDGRRRTLRRPRSSVARRCPAARTSRSRAMAIRSTPSRARPISPKAKPRSIEPLADASFASSRGFARTSGTI